MEGLQRGAPWLFLSRLRAMVARPASGCHGNPVQSHRSACNNNFCALQGDVQKVRKLLATSGRVLANTVDENRRRCCGAPLWAPHTLFAPCHCLHLTHRVPAAAGCTSWRPPAMQPARGSSAKPAQTSTSATRTVRDWSGACTPVVVPWANHAKPGCWVHAGWRHLLQHQD